MLTPCNEYLLVEWLSTEPLEKSGGGVLLVNRDPNMPKYGLVMAVGPGRYSESGHFFPPPVAVGDLVLTYPNPGTAVDVDGRLMRMMRPADILAVIPHEKVPADATGAA